MLIKPCVALDIVYDIALLLTRGELNNTGITDVLYTSDELLEKGHT